MKKKQTKVLYIAFYSRIGEQLEEHIPNLESLILTGNQIEELGDVDVLTNLKNLTTLSLLHNPITAKQHYRLYIIHKFPQLHLLDFRKIRMKEREEAKVLFKSKKGKEIQKEISKRAKTFIPGGNIHNIAKSKGKKKCFGYFLYNHYIVGLSDQEIKKIREAISKASSLEEVERLQKLLQSGQIPGQETNGTYSG